MTSFLFGDPELVSITRQEATTEILELEATLEEGHTGTAETTDHPVEDGADITDHIRRKPDELTLKGIVSNYPVLVLSSFRAEPSIPGGDAATRAEEAHRWLRETKDQGLLVKVSTSLRDYENLAIIGINVVRDKDRSNIIEVDLTLREIIIAVTEQVAPPNAENPSRGAASQLGRKGAATAPPPTAAGSQSILASAFSAFGF